MHLKLLFVGFALVALLAACDRDDSLRPTGGRGRDAITTTFELEGSEVSVTTSQLAGEGVVELAIRHRSAVDVAAAVLKQSPTPVPGSGRSTLITPVTVNREKEYGVTRQGAGESLEDFSTRHFEAVQPGLDQRGD